MTLVKCNKCKRISVEISKIKAEAEGFLDAIMECDCGNTYKNFSEVLNVDSLQKGITLSTILGRDDD